MVSLIIKLFVSTNSLCPVHRLWWQFIESASRR